MTWRFVDFPALHILRLLGPLILGVLLLASAIPACDSRHEQEGNAGEDKQVEEEEDAARTVMERGPLKIMVEVTPKKARLSDEPVLTLTLEAEQGVEVQKPPFGESLGAFVIRDFREPLPEIIENRTRIQQIYTLEPTQTGTLPIFPIKVTFIDNRPDGDGEEHSLETEGLEIEVASALGTEAPSLEDMKSAVPPMELPMRPMSRLWWILPGSLIALGALVLWLRRRKTGEESIAKKLSPQEIAFLEFQKLLEDDWIEKDIKIFYVELTGIVRRYIERTTNIRAPEQTTEEFLREIGQKTVFPEPERLRLQRFLESADLVKFAAFHPGKEEIEDSFQRAKIFIGLDREEVAA
ncbi:MAG: hypothetical protein ABIK28_05270 [Planctomycetota bacterium]